VVDNLREQVSWAVARDFLSLGQYQHLQEKI
jgi:hypothetical protein